MYTDLDLDCKFTDLAPLTLQFWATVYTDLDSDCKFTDLAPLTPQFWGGSEFKVPQNWGI